MKDLFTDKWFSNNLSCSNVKKRKLVIILHLTIVQNNDTLKWVLFSSIESNILTDKNGIQMAKKIKWTKKLKLSQRLITKFDPITPLTSECLHHNYKCLIFVTKD